METRRNVIPARTQVTSATSHINNREQQGQQTQPTANFRSVSIRSADDVFLMGTFILRQISKRVLSGIFTTGWPRLLSASLSAPRQKANEALNKLQLLNPCLMVCVCVLRCSTTYRQHTSSGESESRCSVSAILPLKPLIHWHNIKTKTAGFPKPSSSHFLYFPTQTFSPSFPLSLSLSPGGVSLMLHIPFTIATHWSIKLLFLLHASWFPHK